MAARVSLNGSWRITGTDPQTGQTLSFDGTVPGHVHPDLQAAGHIPDPFFRDGADGCQWVERWNWRYERSFDLDESFDPEWAEIDFRGLDTFAFIEINGLPVGRTSNMLIPHRFEVGRLLTPGRNRIAVDFTNIWSMIEGKRLDYPCAFNNAERLHIRRMQCTFHWDWVNRFVSYGIWRPVTLASYDRACVRDLFVHTKSLAPGIARLSIELTPELRTNEPITANVEVVAPDGHCVSAREWSVAAGRERWETEIADPSLWWPAGYGEQPLYTCRATLVADDGRLLDSRDVTFGIRTVEIEETPDRLGSAEWERTMRLRTRLPEADKNGDAPGSGFTVRVNGEPIFCRGGNWVPADPWPSRVTAEWYDRLVRLARDANINCLRAWGGGIYEREAFWDACDRYGVLVCQDFIMACALYPEDDPGFLDALRAEVPIAIRELRNHPSLAWWNGDNENGMNGDEDDPAYWGRKIAEEITGPACVELDPSRVFLPTSPYRGKPNNCATMGDCHISALPWDPEDLSGDMRGYRERIEAHIGRFMSESTVAGTPPVRSLLKFLAPEDLTDPSAEMLYFHTKDNPYLRTRLYDVQTILATKLFGGSEDACVRLARQGYLQYEWIRLAVEAARRSRPYCAGILFWMYNDCWPATGWSMVDYYRIPKAGWYAMKRASAPVIPSLVEADGRIEVWICNDTLAPFEGTCDLRVQPWRGAPSWEKRIEACVPANSSARVATLPMDESTGYGRESVLVCDLGESRAWLYAGMPFEMAPPPVKLRIERTGTPCEGRVTIEADGYARVVTLDADAVFSDNYFDLLPNERRTVTYTADADSGSSLPEVTCWNQDGRE